MFICERVDKSAGVWMRSLLYTGIPVVLLSLILLLDGCRGYVRVCYYTNWAQFRPARFLPEDVDPTLCTHLVFAFARVQDDSLQPTEYNDLEMYGRLLSHKTSNPSLKVLLSVGGWLAGGAAFSRLVSREESMQRFVGDATRYLRLHGFDGLDVDWEFPGSPERDSEPADRVRFTRLLQMLREGFEEEAVRSGQTRLLLTAAVAPDLAEARQYYQIPQVARTVDFVHLMAYDFYGQWDLSQGVQHHSALLPEVRKAVDDWMREGCPPGKLVLGVPAFARTFVLAAAPRGNGVGDPALPVSSTPGVPDLVSRNGGLLTYQEVCEKESREGWRRLWLTEQQAPASLGNISSSLWAWAGYDDVDSLTAKASYVKERGLAGVMVWSLASDDFNNRCGQGSWPLLTTLKQQLPDVTQTTTIPAPTTTTVTTTTTTTTIAGINGRNEGRAASPSDAFPTTVTTATSAVAPDSQDKTGTGYRQCRISENFGPSLRCSGHRGKRGYRQQFYLFCFDGFFAIECSCLPAFFYNRCRQACDADSNFSTCPSLY